LPVGSAAGRGAGRCLATQNPHGSGTACTTNGRGGRPGSNGGATTRKRQRTVSV